MLKKILLEGIKIGHFSHIEGATGVTVILCPEGMTPGIDIRGSATSTRQIDSLFPGHIVNKIHAVCITGGSAYGLSAGRGVMRYLEEMGAGFPIRGTTVPIVPTMAVFDLAIGRSGIRPDDEMAYQACKDARTTEIMEGSVGAGTGATVGKFFGIERATKGGVGMCFKRFRDGLIVGAVVVVNSYGDVLDPESGQIIAGARTSRKGKRFANTLKLYLKGVKRPVSAFQNTTIGVVMTNAVLDKVSASLVSRLSQGGVVKCISPAHSIYDGDIIITISSNEIDADTNRVGLIGEQMVMNAIKRAVYLAEPVGGIPSASQLSC